MPKKSWRLLRKINRKKLLFLLVSIQYNISYAEYLVPDPENVITTIGEVKKAELNPGSIKMLIWNLYKGQRKSFENSFLELAKSKDILILQEMFLDHKMVSLFNRLGDFYFVGATSFIDSGVRTGVLTAAQSRARDSKYIRSNFNEPVSKTPKMSLLNYYAVRGFKSELLVVNTHAINFVTVSEYENQIQDLYLKVKDYEGPMIFAGDFNTWSLGRMEILKGYIGKLKLKEVSFVKDDRIKFLGYPLDHIFYSSGLQLINATVRGELDGSDHKALEVEFFLEHH
jgi:endonuclease/exonuclease/phosphatase (EEP) superfamily protein YafD